MKVSVVVTTYNGIAHIREQLDSVLHQTYPLHEIIVQDDGSSDGTWELLQDYASSNSNLKVYRNQSDHGVNGNVYSAMERATGDLIAICDQDDIWEPQRVGEQVDMIGDNLLVGGQTIPFSTDGSEVHYDSRTPNCNVLRLIFASAVPGHSMLLKPELLKAYKRNNVSCFDAQLQVVAAAMERFVYQGVCPVHQRRHGNAMTYTKPVNSSHGIGNIVSYLMDCIRIYPKAYPVMKERMKAWQELLEGVDCNTQSMNEVLTMIKLMQGKGVMHLLRLETFCYRHRRVLFHTVERDSLMLRIRALLFPLTSVYYYRTII